LLLGRIGAILKINDYYAQSFMSFATPAPHLLPYPYLVKLRAWPCCLRQQFLDAMVPTNPRGLSIDLGDYEFALTFQYSSWPPLVAAQLRLHYNLWSDPATFALLYPDASKPHLNHPAQWPGTPEQIADHTLHLLDGIFANPAPEAIWMRIRWHKFTPPSMRGKPLSKLPLGPNFPGARLLPGGKAGRRRG
jgi:hypothetical protein